LLLIATAAGCAKTSPSRHEERPIPADRVLDFATLYGRNCAGCHGANGQFGPAPPLNDPLFLAIVPDAVLSMIVSEGRPGTPMPAFSRAHGGPLTDEQVRALAAGIKPRWRAERSGPPPPAYPVTTGHTKGDPVRGRQVFSRACSPCHGDEGRGGEDKVGPIHDPAFLALISDQAVRRYVITGRPDLGMPSFAGKWARPNDFKPLTPEDVADLVALLSAWREKDDSRRTE
jgi:mono/diheme cytochrome c family protein